MEKIDFYKLSGSGNDFIIIDNRSNIIDEDGLTAMIKGVCRRKMSVGADGFILVEDSAGADFKWRFFNSDGSVAEMCGNGARCAARFAHLNGIAGQEMKFETLAGEVNAKIMGDLVKVQMPDPSDLRIDYILDLEDGPVSVCSVNTGVPHVVLIVEDIENTPVNKMGRAIRYHLDYAPAGTNANFIGIVSENRVAIRTYERGVEDETFACGTGSIAGALVASIKFGIVSPAEMLTRGGECLYVHFKKGDKSFSDIYLEGDARVIYKGELQEGAW